MQERQRETANSLPNEFVQMDGRTGIRRTVRVQRVLRAIKDRKL